MVKSYRNTIWWRLQTNRQDGELIEDDEFADFEKHDNVRPPRKEWFWKLEEASSLGTGTYIQLYNMYNMHTIIICDNMTITSYKRIQYWLYDMLNNVNTFFQNWLV